MGVISEQLKQAAAPRGGMVCPIFYSWAGSLGRSHSLRGKPTPCFVSLARHGFWMPKLRAVKSRICRGRS